MHRSESHDPHPEIPAEQLLLYSELADWWHLLSDPADYADEAALVHDLIGQHITGGARTLLELGSGGGNNASHLKRDYDLTLVDVAPAMIAASKRLNPECEHVVGDMRTVRLERLFDVVFVHDAVMYLRTEEDLRCVMETAKVHCRPGGVVIFVPDCTAELYKPFTKHGGHDDAGRSLRYLEWVYRPDPEANTVVTEFAYLLREGEQVRCFHEEHVTAVFGREVWLALLREQGLVTATVMDSYEREIFIGRA